MKSRLNFNQDTLNELKHQRATLDNIIKLNEDIKQGYSHEDQHDYELNTDGMN